MFSEKEPAFWSLGLIHLSYEMRTRPWHDWNEAQKQLNAHRKIEQNAQNAHRKIEQNRQSMTTAQNLT